MLRSPNSRRKISAPLPHWVMWERGTYPLIPDSEGASGLGKKTAWIHMLVESFQLWGLGQAS